MRLKQWDVFLSHASEDREMVALPLTEALRRLGVRVWLDEFQIDIGDSIRRKIDDGLANSRFGVVILSERFLNKHWTGHELDALWELEVVLPVWHGIDKQLLMKYSPLLAGRKAISTAEGIDAVARIIAARVFKPSNGSDTSSSQIARDFAILLAKPAAPKELIGFVAAHPKILACSLRGDIHSEDLLRVAVQLGPNIVDFCIASYQRTTHRFSDYQFILFGSVDSPLFDNGRPSESLDAAIKRAKAIGAWLSSNVSQTRELLRDVPNAVLTRIVAGRRPQPGSPVEQALSDLNDELIRIQVRTFDWLLDSALSLAEGGEAA